MPEEEVGDGRGTRGPNAPTVGPQDIAVSKKARKRKMDRIARKANREHIAAQNTKAVELRNRRIEAERRRLDDHEIDHATTLTDLNDIAPLVEQPNDLPSCWKEAYDMLIVTAVKLHLLSRPLARLPPVRRWSKPLLNAWVAALDSFGPELLVSVEKWETDRDPEPLTRAYINLLALPGHIIVNASNLVPAAGSAFIEHPSEMDKNEVAIELGNESLVERRSRRPRH